MLVSRRAVNEYLDREFESFEWMKKLPREVVLREIKSVCRRTRPVFKTDPWTHQLVCFYIGLAYPRFLFLLDMGAGKTKILLDLFTHLHRTRKLNRALVTIPRIINISDWKTAVGVHSDLECVPVNMESIEGKRDALLSSPKGQLTLIDYAGLHLALSKKSKKTGKLILDEKSVRHFERAGYNALALDESHKLGNHNSFWFSIIRALSERVDYCYGSTGTVFGTDMDAIWAQYRLIDGGETFGENLSLFRSAFFTTKTTPWKTEFVFDRSKTALLHRMLGNRSIRYDENELHDLPKRIPILRRLDMEDEQLEHYLRALEGLINANGSFKELEGQWQKLREITSGYLSWKDGHGEHVIDFKQSPKLNALEGVIEEIGTSKVVIAYDYTLTGERIAKRLKSLGVGYEWFYGGTKDKEASKQRFLTDPNCRAFVMNSEAGGTGTDGLQHVARYLVFFESPTNPITRQQTLKRIDRNGQKFRPYIIDLACRRSVDLGILEKVADNRDLFEDVMRGNAKELRKFLLAD